MTLKTKQKRKIHLKFFKGTVTICKTKITSGTADRIEEPKVKKN